MSNVYIPFCYAPFVYFVSIVNYNLFSCFYMFLLFHPTEDGRSGTFVIGDDHFPTSLLDLPCVVESYKTYDDSCLIKTADIGQVIFPLQL